MRVPGDRKGACSVTLRHVLLGFVIGIGVAIFYLTWLDRHGRGEVPDERLQERIRQIGGVRP